MKGARKASRFSYLENLLLREERFLGWVQLAKMGHFLCQCSKYIRTQLKKSIQRGC